MPCILPEILHVLDALERYPDKNLVFYHRLSSPGQGSKGKLAEKTLAAENELLALTTGTGSRLLWVVKCIEEGKMSTPSRKLIDAAAFAAERGAILVAADLSRFIRSEAYHRCTNSDAEPTQKELAQLGRLTNGVILATILHPNATESERHSLATKRTGKCGRPPKIRDSKTALRMMYALADGASLATVSKLFGLTKSCVQRWLEKPVPVEICDACGGPQIRVIDAVADIRAYREAKKKGLLDFSESKR